MDEGVRRAKEGNFAFIGESVSLDLAIARHCELVRAHEIVGMRGFSIAASLGKSSFWNHDHGMFDMWHKLKMDCEPVEGSPIVKNLSVAILQLSEAGELAYLRSKWWASSCMADKGRSSAVQPHSLRGMFLVLSIGLGLGALAAILELTSKSRKNAAEQKVRSSSLAYHLGLAKNSNSKSTWLYTSVLVNRNFKPCRDSYA